MRILKTLSFWQVCVERKQVEPTCAQHLRAIRHRNIEHVEHMRVQEDVLN